MNRSWSPNFSMDESHIMLFPSACSSPSGTTQQAVQQLGWAGNGVQVWKGRFFFSFNFGKQNRRIKGSKTCSLPPNYLLNVSKFTKVSRITIRSLFFCYLLTPLQSWMEKLMLNLPPPIIKRYKAEKFRAKITWNSHSITIQLWWNHFSICGLRWD